MKQILTISTISLIVSLTVMVATVFILPFIGTFTADQRATIFVMCFLVLLLSLMGALVSSINLGTKGEQPE